MFVAACVESWAVNVFVQHFRAILKQTRPYIPGDKIVNYNMYFTFWVLHPPSHPTSIQTTKTNPTRETSPDTKTTSPDTQIKVQAPKYKSRQIQIPKIQHIYIYIYIYI